jgi:tRNA threonylcarbamoyl adenosine modification protein (Sua5/YciO/YrdC/YwlC family)
VDGPVLSRVLSLAADRAAAIAAATGALRAGELVVVPTDTVYGIAADAFAAPATRRIFEIKGRPRSLPLPVLVSRPRQAWALAASVPPGAEALVAAYWPGPLTIVLPQGDNLEWDLGDGNGTIALRMPNHPALLELLERVGPLAATSANMTGQPTPSDVGGIRAHFADAVSVYVDGGPAALDRGSTIVDLTGPAPVIVREGPISVGEVERVLAVSGQG